MGKEKLFIDCLRQSISFMRQNSDDSDIDPCASL